MLKRAFKELLDLPTQSGHASTIARTGGETLMAWFGGTGEGKPDVDIYMARRSGGAWGAPYRIAGEEGLPHWNPVFFAEGERVDLYYKVGHTIPGWQTRWMRSADGGRSFCAPQELVPGDVGGRGPVRNKPMRLRSGRLLAPASIETATRWDAFVDILDGAAYRQSALVPLWREGEAKPAAADVPKPYLVRGKGVIQPSLWQSDDGNVHMLLRSTEGQVLRSDSNDEGETWRPAYEIGLPNNNSGLDLIRLPDGRIALVMNPVSGNWAARSPLSLSLSMDGGERFQLLAHLEVRPGEYSYPAVLCEGNRLFVSYTWNRTRMAYWELELEES